MSEPSCKVINVRKVDFTSTQFTTIIQIKNNVNPGLPTCSVVKNPPANAGDVGSTPGAGRSHMAQSNQAQEPQVLSLCSRAQELGLLRP